ncbi:MAG TPA: 30S ribosomal protein S1, partial [Opitutaceae bacterium]|nr:30S ribosomal protein S1 [Opitutaceae bacterium]
MSSVMQELLAQSSFDKLKQGTIVAGQITEIRQNEVVVDIGGKAEAVVPANEFMDVGELQIGQQIEVLIEKLEDKNGNPVVSFDKAEQKKNWDNILTKFPEGSIATGRVKAKVKGGLIVNIGVDSFLPASHIDVQPPKNLDQYVGQTYDFKVLKINLDRQNVVLSRRELIEEQRANKRRALLDSIQPGQVRKGIVKNITDFGAFIDLDGMDGLLHITDMSWGRITHPSEMLKQGEEVNVMIIEVNREKERVSLGLKQTTKNPWDEIDRKFPVGAKVHGKVVNLVPYGAFVEIEPGVEGLVHITEMSWTKRITKPGELLKVGQELDAVVLGIQKEEQKISLGLRQLEPNPWDMVRHNYPIGARVRGKVVNLVPYGAFIELEEGIDGMVHVSDMSWTRKVNHPSEVLKKGDDSIPKAEAYYKKLVPLAKRSVATLEARSRLVDALAQWAVLKDISTRSQSGALVIETSEAASPGAASKPAAPDPLEAARKALGAPLVGFGGEQDIEQEPALKDLVLHRLNRRTAEWNRRLAGECHAQELANIQAVNDYRETLGLARMEIDLRLMQAARGHSKEMTDLKYFSHVSPTKGREGFGDRCRLAGYQGAGGENIASANNVTGQQA